MSLKGKNHKASRAKLYTIKDVNQDFTQYRNLKHVFILLLLICSILTGCWDLREIERRLFVGGVAIDISDVAGSYEFTFSMPVVREIVGGQEG
jgi:hypothetical protein